MKRNLQFVSNESSCPTSKGWCVLSTRVYYLNNNFHDWRGGGGMTAPRCGSTQHDVIHCLVVSCNMLSGHWQYWFWSGTWQQLHNHVHSQESSRNLKYAFNLDTRVHKHRHKATISQEEGNTSGNATTFQQKPCCYETTFSRGIKKLYWVSWLHSARTAMLANKNGCLFTYPFLCLVGTCGYGLIMYQQVPTMHISSGSDTLQNLTRQHLWWYYVLCKHCVKATMQRQSQQGNEKDTTKYLWP